MVESNSLLDYDRDRLEPLARRRTAGGSFPVCTFDEVNLFLVLQTYSFRKNKILCLMAGGTELP